MLFPKIVWELRSQRSFVLFCCHTNRTRVQLKAELTALLVFISKTHGQLNGSSFICTLTDYCVCVWWDEDHHTHTHTHTHTHFLPRWHTPRGSQCRWASHTGWWRPGSLISSPLSLWSWGGGHLPPAPGHLSSAHTHTHTHTHTQCSYSLPAWEHTVSRAEQKTHRHTVKSCREAKQSVCEQEVLTGIMSCENICGFVHNS